MNKHTMNLYVPTCILVNPHREYPSELTGSSCGLQEQFDLEGLRLITLHTIFLLFGDLDLAVRVS